MTCSVVLFQYCVMQHCQQPSMEIQDNGNALSAKHTSNSSTHASSGDTALERTRRAFSPFSSVAPCCRTYGRRMLVSGNAHSYDQAVCRAIYELPSALPSHTL